MSSDSGVGGASSNGGASGNDWAAVATAKVESVVSVIRDRTVTPVQRIVRYAIFGLLAIFIATLLAVLVGIGAVRVLDNYLFHWRVWASYLVIGGIFSAIGLLLSRMRHPRS
jgi:undecaprenyl pyrophosphate phosphatase UppP